MAAAAHRADAGAAARAARRRRRLRAVPRALRRVASRSSPGGVLALLGSNGAGKTTVARVCSGLDRSRRAGEVLLRRRRRHRAARRSEFARLGIVARARGPLGVRVAHRRGEPRARRSGAAAGEPACGAALDEAYELFPRLGERRRQLAGTLSGGEQRMLSLARVLVEKPRLLIADELSLGLAPIIVDEVYAHARDDPRRGHDAAASSSSTCTTRSAIADDAIVLIKGEVAFSGPVSELGDLSERLLTGGAATAS